MRTNIRRWRIRFLAKTRKLRETPSPAERPTEATFRALLRTCGLLKNAMEPFFAGFGISGSQWSVLRTLHRAADEGEHGLRLTDLGGRLLIQPPSVTGVVDRLERLGLVAREAAPSDLRAKQVVLTPGGQQLVQRVLERHAARVQAVLGALSGAEQCELHRLLDRLGEHLEHVGPNESSEAAL